MLNPALLVFPMTAITFIALTTILAACAASGYLATTPDGKEACKGSNRNARR
jgi:hypothetical protein